MDQLNSIKNADAIASALKEGMLVYVTGRQGPTGKTTLVRQLREQGIQASELWETDLTETKNMVAILIVLNEPL